QAVLHSFSAGHSEPGFVGEPGAAFDAKLEATIGTSLEALIAADDQSRVGVGVAASNTQLHRRDRAVKIPAGTPTHLGTFQFHDLGVGLDEGERLAVFAFDGARLRKCWNTVSGTELAASLRALPSEWLGPLSQARDAASAWLDGLATEP